MPKNRNVRQLPESERRVNLQAPDARIGQPRATELFTTVISHVTAAATMTYPSLKPNYSPPPQVSAQFGDLIVRPGANPQANSDIPTRFIHHANPTPGEKLAASADVRCTRQIHPKTLGGVRARSLARRVGRLRPRSSAAGSKAAGGFHRAADDEGVELLHQTAKEIGAFELPRQFYPSSWSRSLAPPSRQTTTATANTPMIASTLFV